VSQNLVGAYAPSNIAIVKYMGKRDGESNLPENPSLSLTLNKLRSYVEIACEENHEANAREVRWIGEPPLQPSVNGERTLEVPRLETGGANRFLRHFERVRFAAPQILSKYGLPTTRRSGVRGSGESAASYTIRSANTFPTGAGIASSASSFAALTLATTMTCAGDQAAFDLAWKAEPELRRDLARLSRLGSGSSCRSFEGPWVMWERECAGKVKASTAALKHFVLLVSDATKTIPSSKAHQLIKESPLWVGRVDRASERFELASRALARGDLERLAKIAWSESWEMHSLFHTAAAPFSYWQPRSVEILQWLSPFVSGPEPPIVSMDAGPNLHLIVDASKASLWRNRIVERYGPNSLLEDEPGAGAAPMRPL
jgi:diphosphomevalonate decarboxylase